MKKQSLKSVSSHYIDVYLARAAKEDALYAKISGADDNGFLMYFAPREYCKNVI